MGSALVFKKYIFKNQQNKLFVYSILILLPFLSIMDNNNNNTKTFV